MKQKNQKMKELGKKGLDKRYATRYEILVELSKLVSKKLQLSLIRWETNHLKELLKAYRDK